MGGKTGRHPKSIEHLKDTGNYRPSKHKNRETLTDQFKKEADQPVPPANIMKNPDALEYWNRLLDGLPKQLLAQVDWGDVYAVCVAWADWLDIHKTTQTMSPEHENYCEIMRLKFQALKTYTMLSAKFGTNPADRGRIKVDKPKSESANPVNVLMDRRKQA